MNLPVITGQVDAKMAPLVHALRAAGFPTTSSCDGAGGGFLTVPWVNVATDAMDGHYLAVGIMRAALVRWLRGHDLVANVVEVFTTMDGEPAFPFIRIEVFSDLSEAQL